MLRSKLFVVSVVSVAANYALEAGAEILIGVAGPMTGVYAWAGDRYQRGAGMAVENLNARGGVLGQRIELVAGDDFCDPDQAVALAQATALFSSLAIGARTPRSRPRKFTTRQEF